WDRDPRSDCARTWLAACLVRGCAYFVFFFSSRRRHTRLVSDWSSDVCSSDLLQRKDPAGTPPHDKSIARNRTRGRHSCTCHPRDRAGRRRSLNSRLDCLRTWQGLYAQCCDAIACTTQHPETKSMEREALAHFGNRTRLMDHKSSDRRRLLVRQIPVHDAIEIPDRYSAIDVD